MSIFGGIVKSVTGTASGLASMAVSGLKSFASSVPNLAVSYANNMIGYYGDKLQTKINDKINDLFGKLGLDSSNKGNQKSYAGTLRKGDGTADGIYEFIAHFKTGIMKANRFRIELNLPKGIKSSDHTYGVNAEAFDSSIKSHNGKFNDKGSINIKCHTATLPQRSLTTTEFRSNSVPFRIPYATSYDPVTLTFYSDGDMDTRNYFELWQSCVMNFGNNTSNFYDEYVADVKIYLQDEYGNDVYGIILFEAFPSNIGMLEVSYSQSNMPLNTLVTLSYKSWLPLSNSNAANFNRTY